MHREQIAALLNRWGLSGESVHEIPDPESGAPRGNIVRIGSRWKLKRFSDRSAAERQLRLAKALAAHGFPTLPRPAADGSGLVCDGGVCYLLTPWIEGEALGCRRFFSPDGLGWALRYGEALGRLDLALASLPLSLPTAQPVRSMEARLPAVSRATGIPEPQLRSLTAKLAERLHGLPCQLIHRDPHPGNVILRDGQLAGFVDFDLAECSVRCFDPCYAATAVLSELESIGIRENARWLPVFSAILRGYDRTAALSDAERTAIPDMVYAIQLICTGFFCEQPQYAVLAERNAALLRWLLDRRPALEAVAQGRDGVPA